jgi:hypothetical protein
MAKKEKDAAPDAPGNGKAKKPGRESGRGMGWRGRMLGVFGLVAAVACLPSAMILLIGMMPALVAALLDRAHKGAKGLTVGAMNLAGCSPFLIQLWSKGNKFDLALSIISDPRTIVVIYSAAGIGYMIDWALTGIIASFMMQSGLKRRKDILRLQDTLERRWGPEVTGEIPLDSYGFPVGDAKTVEE